MEIIETIEGVDWIQHDDGSVTAKGVRGRVDTDGAGYHHGDRTAQNQTTYKNDLNADLDFYGVVPGIIRRLGKGIFIGCQMRVEDTVTGKAHDLVCGDTGPNDRSGEFARIVLLFFGLSGDPNTGGTNDRRFNVTLWPSRPAQVGLKHYKLEPA